MPVILIIIIQSQYSRMSTNRASRSQYFARVIFYAALFFIASIILCKIWPSDYCIPVILALAGVYICSLIPLEIKRLHDMNLSGWWLLLLFIPIVNGIFKMILLFKKGTHGKNRFGPEPCPTALEGWMIPIAIAAWIIALVASSW